MNLYSQDLQYQQKRFLIKRGYKEDLIYSQVGPVFNLDRSSVLEDSKKRGLKKDYVDRMVLTLDFQPALLAEYNLLQIHFTLNYFDI